MAGDLCDHFEISDEKKTSITSNQNPGLSLLLALHKMGVINQSKVGPLEPPFTKFRLVQAVAKIQEYQSLVEVETDLHQQTVGFTIEDKRNLFVKFLLKKLKSWYDTMTPVPWKKSCRWKSSDLFVGSGLILTNSKTQKSVSDIDEQCKIHYSDILGHVSLKDENRIIIEGEPGSGKTMLSSQLAYDWSQGKVKDVNIFILLPLKFVEKKTLVEAIKDFYLPEGKGLSLADIEDIITSEGRNCCFLLDGLEEYNGKDETSTEELSEVGKVMAKDKYPNCKVIITSRSGFSQDLPPCPMLKLGQFSEIQRHCYIEKVFSDDNEKQMEVKKFIDDTPFVLALCSVPLLFVLVVHNIEGMVSVQNVQQDRIAPFVGRMVETLCPSAQLEDNEDTFREHTLERLPGKDRRGLGLGHRLVNYVSAGEYHEYFFDYWYNSWDDYSDNESQVLQTSLKSFQKSSQMISLETLAFNGLCRGRQQLLWQKRFMEENVRNFKQYLDSGILVIEEAVNVGKAVERSMLEIPTTDEFAVTASSEFPETNYIQWNVLAIESDQAAEVHQESFVDKTYAQGRGRHTVESEGDEDTYRKHSLEVKETIPEAQLKVDKTFAQGGRRCITEGRSTEQNNESNKKEPSFYVESQSIDQKPPLTPQHVSLQVKFLHKVIQEWFAAKHLADIFWNDGELSLPNKNRFLREHLQQINPADLHYVLRFTCALCPPSCHFILKYLFTTYHSEERNLPEHVINCISLCLAEYDGYRGHYIKDAISEVCKASITIHSEDSRLLQQAKVSMMQFASKCELPVSQLQLDDVIVKAAKDTLTFNSGASLNILSTLQKIEMSRWDQTLNDEDYSNIIKFVMNSATIKEASLFFPSQPPIVQPENLKEETGKEVIVNWHIGHLVQTLNPTTGTWQIHLKRNDSRITETPSVEDNRERPSSLETTETITKNGGTLEIPNTGVVLIIPPNALPEHMEQCEMYMRIIPREQIKDEKTNFASNSSTVVELLPDGFILRKPVRLALPHCLVLRRNMERKARIFISHHTKGSPPQWEEQSHLSYHLEDTACIMMLDRFCFVKYSINDEIVEAKKLVVYSAARKLEDLDPVAEIHAGYYCDLPSEKKVLEDTQDLIITHRKTLYFLKSHDQNPLQVSLDNIFSGGWKHCCKEPSLQTQEISYEHIQQYTNHAVLFELEKESDDAGNLLCVISMSQKNEETAVQLGVHLKVINEGALPVHIMDQTQEMDQCKECVKTITKSGGTLEIDGTDVKLQIPPGALPLGRNECSIHLRIIASRIIEDRVTSLCSNSSTAVELVPGDLRLQYPAKLTLPHWLTFKDNEERRAQIYVNNEIGSPSPWKEQAQMRYKLTDNACIIQLDKLCCVKYSIDAKAVTAKKISLYTAAKRFDEKDELAEVEVGYHSDIPGGGELLQLNPSMKRDSRRQFLLKEEQKLPLQLSLVDISPQAQWKCCVPQPEEKQQEIPFKLLASSIEHSHLYVLQKVHGQPSRCICRFKALQKGDRTAIMISLKVYPQKKNARRPAQKDDNRKSTKMTSAESTTATFQGEQPEQPIGTTQNQQKKASADFMTATFQYLSKKLGTEWMDVGRNLRLQDEELDQIKADYSYSIQETIYRMLLYWKRHQGSKATTYALFKALEQSGRTDLAEQL